MINVDDTLDKFQSTFSEREESAILINSSDKTQLLLTHIICLHAFCRYNERVFFFMPSITVMWMVLFMQMTRIILNKSELSAEKKVEAVKGEHMEAPSLFLFPPLSLGGARRTFDCELCQY